MVEHFLNLYDHFSIHEQLLRSVKCTVVGCLCMSRSPNGGRCLISMLIVVTEHSPTYLPSL